MRRGKLLPYLFKFLVLAGGTWFFIVQWKSRQPWVVFSGMLKEGLFGERSVYLYAVAGLMMINWGLEAWKWKILSRCAGRASYVRCWRDVWVGLFTGSLSPGRSFEFSGRIFFHPFNRWPALAWRYFFSSFIQFSVTVLFGIWGLLNLNLLWNEHRGRYFFYVGMVLVIGLVVYMSVEFFGNEKKWLSHIVKKLSRFGFSEEIPVENPYIKKKILLQTVILSLFRYLIFSLQFYLLMRLYVPFVSVSDGLAVISVYYLLTSIVPMVSVFEIPVRSWIAFHLVRNSGIGWEAITFMVTSLWVINLFLPSLAGMILFIIGFDPERWKMLNSKKKNIHV